MKLHPRSRLVSKAKTDLRIRLTAWFKETPELTDAEEIEILTSVFISLIHGAAEAKIREERKEDD